MGTWSETLRKDSYRALFFGAALWGALCMGIWTLALAGVNGIALTPTLHAEWMLWGVLGGGVLGFAGTAYPRQNQAPPPSTTVITLAAILQLSGQGTLVASAWIPALGPVATVLGEALWLGALLWVLPVARDSLRRAWDGTTFVVPVTLAGAATSWLLIRLYPTPTIGVDLGVHGFLLPVAIGILDRMLPFFSRAVPGYTGVRHRWFSVVFLGLSLARAASGAAGLSGAPFDVLLAGVLVYAWTGWNPRFGIRTPMVAVLHVGLAWILLGYIADAVPLGLPRSLPIHLWLAGGMVTLLFGFGTRVTLGHSGQPIVMGGWLKTVLGLAGAAAALRVAAPVVAVATGSPLYIAAGALMAGAFVTWLAGYGRYLLR